MSDKTRRVNNAGRTPEPIVKRAKTDALHVQLLRGHDAGLPWVRPVDADGPVLLLLGVLVAHGDLRGFNLGAAFERDLGFAVLLQLQQPCGW